MQQIIYIFLITGLDLQSTNIQLSAITQFIYEINNDVLIESNGEFFFKNFLGKLRQLVHINKNVHYMLLIILLNYFNKF